MKIMRKSAVLVLFLAGLVPVLAAADGEVRLTVRLIRIPREQTWDIEEAAGPSGPLRLQCRGDVTADFPDGVVFLATELAAAAREEAILEAIRDRVRFGNSRYPAERIRMEEMKTWEARLGPKAPNGETRFEIERTPDSSEDFRFQAELRPGAGTDVVIKLRFDAGSSWRAGTLGGGLSAVLFDETIVVPASRQSKLMLFGFPAHGRGARGGVYWLAVSAAPLS